MQKLFFVFFIAILSASFHTANRQARTELFRIVGTERAFSERISPASVAEYTIDLDSRSLADPEIFDISFPDGKKYSAVRTSSEIRAMDNTTWRGKIDEGDVILTFYKGHVAGLIFTPDGVFEIVPRGEDHILSRLDQSLFPECGGGVVSNEAPKFEIEQDLSNNVDSGDRIDVLVVYTTATKNLLGGDAQAQAFSQSAIDATNTAYINSKIRQRVRLVTAKEWVYTETASYSTDLSNLRNSATIQADRDASNADLVAALGEISGACGVGYLMGSNTTSGNPNNGFTVTARSCAVGNLTFAHELGHNMGSQHNPENGSGATYPFGYGHYVNGNFRTVMSYSNPCGSGCTRRPYFSNPSVAYFGVLTGIDNARDNVRSINLTADPIANYRYSGSSLTLSNLNSGGVIRRMAANTVNWKSAGLSGNVRIDLSRDGGTSWETLVSSTPDDGSEALSIIGKPTLYGRIRIVSLGNTAVTDSSVNNFRIQ